MPQQCPSGPVRLFPVLPENLLNMIEQIIEGNVILSHCIDLIVYGNRLCNFILR